MLKEVDFSKGVRGKHVGRVRVVGPVKRMSPNSAVGKIQKTLEADLKERGLWDKLDRSERADLRRDWAKKIAAIVD